VKPLPYWRFLIPGRITKPYVSYPGGGRNRLPRGLAVCSMEIGMVRFEIGTRVTVHRVQSASDQSALAEDVRQGLTARQKFLQPKYFYDEMGSILFEAICRLPEYYVTRAEMAILEKFHGAIIDALPGPLTLIEAGSGSAMKTRILIKAIVQRQPALLYVPMDISQEALVETAKDLTTSFPTLKVDAFVGDYFDAFKLLHNVQTQRKLLLFLGSSLGNYEPPSDLGFLSMLRSVLQPGEGLLLGLDLKKSAAILEPAYDDALGVTAAFNLNLLNRLNRELGANFNLRQFSHHALYNQELGRIEMRLVSQCAQTVYIRHLDLRLDFAAGETIYTESSYKYDQRQIHHLAAQAGFFCAHTWQDTQAFFSLSLLVAK
jgi:dimethylhistidine N-methyltransferase